MVVAAPGVEPRLFWSAGATCADGQRVVCAALHFGNAVAAEATDQRREVPGSDLSISGAYLEAQAELPETVAAHGVGLAFERAEDRVLEAARDLHDSRGVADELRQSDILVWSGRPTVVFVFHAQLSVGVACSLVSTSPAVYFHLSFAFRRHILI